MNKTFTPIEELTYEQARDELEGIVAALESERHALNEAMLLFERGLALTHRCTLLLEAAELKVQQIAGDEITPFNA